MDGPAAGTGHAATTGAPAGSSSLTTTEAPAEAAEPPNIPRKLLSLGSLAVTPELAAIGLVYFTQGILELGTLAQSLQLRDLGASPAQVALFLSLAGLPWAIKPIIGFVSDTVPLWGYRRRSYLLLASLAGASAYAWMGGHHTTAVGFFAGMALASAAGAVSDVVVDSMVVERARQEAAESAGTLQSLCWASYAVAQILTASISGSLVQAYGPGAVFQLTAVFPLLVGGSAMMLHETPVSPPTPTPKHPASLLRLPLPLPFRTRRSKQHGAARKRWSLGLHSPLGLGQQRRMAGSSGGGASDLPPPASPTLVPQLASHVTPLAATHPPVPAPSPCGLGTGAESASAPTAMAEAQAEGGLGARMQALWTALSRGDVAAPLAFLMLLSATPSADSAMFFYQTEVLGFTPSFLGQIQLAAACASLAAVLLYNTTLKRVPLRQLMLWGTVLAAGLQASQLVLVSGAHRALGLDDHLFVLGGSVVLDVVQNVLSMPMMVLAARMCPPGMEATMFASLMSLLNLADGVRVGGGAALMAGLGITSDDFTHLPTLLAVCNAALLLPLPLLGLIPDKYNAPEDSATSDKANATTTAPAPATATSMHHHPPAPGTALGAEQAQQVTPAPVMAAAAAQQHPTPLKHEWELGSRLFEVRSVGSAPAHTYAWQLDGGQGGEGVRSQLAPSLTPLVMAGRVGRTRHGGKRARGGLLGSAAAAPLSSTVTPNEGARVVWRNAHARTRRCQRRAFVRGGGLQCAHIGDLVEGWEEPGLHDFSAMQHSGVYGPVGEGFGILGGEDGGAGESAGMDPHQSKGGSVAVPSEPELVVA